MQKYPQNQSYAGSIGQTLTTNVSITLCHWQIRHQTHVLCGCNAFGTELNWVPNQYGPYPRCRLDKGGAFTGGREAHNAYRLSHRSPQHSCSSDSITCPQPDTGAVKRQKAHINGSCSSACPLPSAKHGPRCSPSTPRPDCLRRGLCILPKVPAQHKGRCPWLVSTGRRPTTGRRRPT